MTVLPASEFKRDTFQCCKDTYAVMLITESNNDLATLVPQCSEYAPKCSEKQSPIEWKSRGPAVRTCYSPSYRGTHNLELREDIVSLVRVGALSLRALLCRRRAVFVGRIM